MRTDQGLPASAIEARLLRVPSRRDPHVRRLASPALFLASSLAAQSFVVPAGASPATGSCVSMPFATAATRCQVLVRDSDLGNQAGVISGLALAPCQTGVRSAATVIVRMAHFSGSALSTTFASNLASPGPARTVLDVASHDWRMVAHTWNEIGLQDAFAYNGSDHLVIDITVTGASIALADTHIDTTNQRVFAFNYTNQATGTNGGNTAFKLKLFLGDANLQLFGSSCVGTFTRPAFSFSGSPRLGGLLGIHCGPTYATTLVFLIGFDTHRPTWPMELSTFGAPGCRLYHDITTTITVFPDATGTGNSLLSIPTVASLAGTPLFVSAAVPDATANAGGFTTTNYGRALLGN